MRSQKKFTKAMVIVVSLTGLFSTALLLNDPPANSEVDVAPLIFSLNSAKLTEYQERGIASVGAEKEAVVIPHIVEVPCAANEFNFETVSPRMRLKGENCVSGQSPKTEIKNNSNGYIATVFHKADYSFTTDYINLSEGKNEITLSFESGDGNNSERKITINRAPASVPTIKN